MEFRKTAYKLIIGIFAISLVGSAFAQGNQFSSGTVRFSGSASGTSSARGSNYRLGIGVGYYVIDGLELGLDAQMWLSSDRNVYELEPSITYVLADLGRFKPYGGVLYRRTFFEGQDDQSAYGGRGGIFLQQSRNLHIRAGVVGIRYGDCDPEFVDCTDFYPEISAGFYF